jgi:SAM-dependent methyltransferase
MIGFNRYRRYALTNSAEFEVRYGWDNHSQAEVESIWDEVVALIPAGVTKILEIGCGGGGLFHKIRAAYPSVDYLGIDMVPENIDTARASLSGEPDSLFEVGLAADTLMRTDADWDFIVSIHAVGADTRPRLIQTYIERINQMAPKGFILVGKKTQLTPSYMNTIWSGVTASSDNETASYYTGARAFMDDSLLKDLHPVYITRDGVSNPKKVGFPKSECALMTGEFNKRMMRSHYADEVLRKKNAAPTDFQGVTVVNGRVTARSTLSVDSDKVANIK